MIVDQCSFQCLHNMHVVWYKPYGALCFILCLCVSVGERDETDPPANKQNVTDSVEREKKKTERKLRKIWNTSMFQHESPSHNTHKLSDLLEPATVGDKHQSSRPHVVSASPLPLQNPEMWMQISVPLHISCFLLRRDLPSQDWLLIIILNIVCTEQLRLAAGTAALCS